MIKVNCGRCHLSFLYLRTHQEEKIFKENHSRVLCKGTKEVINVNKSV